MTKYIEQFLSHLAAIAVALTAIADAMKAGPAVTLEETKGEPAKPAKGKGKCKQTPTESKPEPKAEEPAEPAKAEKPTKPEPKVGAPTGGPTKADLRKLGTALVSDGKKTEFLALLKKYDAANISALGDHEIDVILPELETLLGKKLAEIAD